MNVFFDCDVLETFSDVDSAHHLGEMVTCVNSPLLFRKVSEYGRKVAKPKHISETA